LGLPLLLEPNLEFACIVDGLVPSSSDPPVLAEFSIYVINERRFF